MPVGDQPICRDDEVRRIDPAWLFGRVPQGFWRQVENRRNYLLWLGYKLGFRRMRDWHRLTYQDLANNCGAALANVYWHGSPVCAVKACFPAYEWQEWFFVQVPRTFWGSGRNRRRYLTWLGEQLAFQRPEDWYRATTEDFQRHRGGTLLVEYRSSVSETVMACFPKRDWMPWMFERTPSNYWKGRKTCREYLQWLGKRLGYRRREDWRHVRRSDFYENCGGSLMNRYHSHWDLLQECFPEWDWEPSQKQLLSIEQILGWADACYAEQGKWPNRHSGAIAGTAETWGAIAADLRAGCRGLSGGMSLATLLSRHRGLRNPKNLPELTERQIVAWAQAHLRATGRWPHDHSGAVIESNGENWASIEGSLRKGTRGLPAGLSIFKLLRKHGLR